MEDFLNDFDAIRSDFLVRSALAKGKKASSRSPPFSFVQSIHASERSFTTENSAHTFEVSIIAHGEAARINF